MIVVRLTGLLLAARAVFKSYRFSNFVCSKYFRAEVGAVDAPRPELINGAAFAAVSRAAEPERERREGIIER